MPSPLRTQQNERLVVDLRPLGIPEVPALGRYRYTQARHGLERHSHAGILEICYLARGTQRYRMGARDYRLRGGDVFITYPGEPHSTGEAPEERGTLYWVQFHLPDRPRHFLACTPDESAALAARLRAIPDRHFRGVPALARLLEEILASATDETNPLRRVITTVKLMELLLQVLACAQRRVNPAVSTRLQPALSLIETRIEESPALEDLALAVGLSLSRFKTRFKEELGMPPAEYILRRKLEAAQGLLAEPGATVTSVAHRLNFSSSQYFSTVFKRYLNRTPRSARKTGPVKSVQSRTSVRARMQDPAVRSTLVAGRSSTRGANHA